MPDPNEFVDVDQPALMALRSIDFSHIAWPYIDTIEFGPVEFRAIEWLEIQQWHALPDPLTFPFGQSRRTSP